MKQHKYRVYDKANKRMVYLGDIFIPKERTCNVCDYNNRSEFSIVSEETYISVEEPGFSELMQYTGFEDKSGTELYVGDLIQDEGEKIHEIYFDCGMFMITPGYDDAEKGDCTGDVLFHMLPEFHAKKIGTIHENPELLGGCNARD